MKPGFWFGWMTVVGLVAMAFLSSCGTEPPERRGHRNILVLGDSLTEGAGLPAEKCFPAVLERLIRDRGYPEVTVTADGISGDVSASGPGRLASRLATARYGILILELGANDGLRGLPVEAMEANLAATLEMARAAGLQVLLVGVRVPIHHGLDYKERFDAVFPALAERYHVPLVPFLLKGVVANPALLLPDGVHPNEKGHERMARTVLRYLEPLL